MATSSIACPDIGGYPCLVIAALNAPSAQPATDTFFPFANVRSLKSLIRQDACVSCVVDLSPLPEPPPTSALRIFISVDISCSDSPRDLESLTI